jgi:Protein of unknown function (DUF4065)
MPRLVPQRRVNPRIKFDRDRFKALVHYICWRCEDPRILGPMKLNKVLWYTDRIHYLRAGQPVTGATYVKQQSGPAARALGPVIDELEKEGGVATRERSWSSDMTQYFARQEPNLSVFKPQEISLVDSVIEAVCLRDALPSTDARADAQVWRLAHIGETLPYCTVFAARPGEITKRDLDWAIDQIRNGRGEINLKELEELSALNPRIEEAYAALDWHLSRDLSIGIQVPVSNASFFAYKQSGNGPLSLPSILVLYTVDLNEPVVCRIRFGFDAEQEELQEELDVNYQKP